MANKKPTKVVKLNKNYIPKYKFGGGFDSKDKANVRDFFGNYGKYLLDNSANAVGIDAVGAGKGIEYSGKSADKFNKVSNVSGAITKAAAPIVANAIVPGSGQMVSAGQQALGGAYSQLGPQNEQGFNGYDANGKPIYNEKDKSAQIGQAVGQIGSMAGGFMGGGSGTANISGMPVAKYGGYMKYAMGGVQYANGGTGQINSEVEKEENAVGPNNEFTQFDGPSHAQGGIKTDMAPDTKIFSDKLKMPGTNKTFAQLNKVNDTTKLEKKAKSVSSNIHTNNSKKLMEMAMNKNSDKIFAMQEQLKRAKLEAYAKRMGISLPPIDNEQMEPQGMSEQSEGEYKYGGIHIKESKKGTFTAAASKHGKSVQAFASQVLANKENYSPAMVKKANFAHNAAGWKHEMGGVQLPYYNIPKYPDGGSMLPKDTLYDKRFDRFTNVSDPAILNPTMQAEHNLAVEKYRPMPTIGKTLPQFTFNAGLGKDYNTQFNEYKVANNLNFKFGGILPKYNGGGTKPYIDPTETDMLDQAERNAYYDNLNTSKNTNNSFTTNSNNKPTSNSRLTGEDEVNAEIAASDKAYAEKQDRNQSYMNAAKGFGNFALQNAGNIYDLMARRNPVTEKYGEYTPSYVSDKPAIAAINRTYDSAINRLPNVTGGNAASVIANTQALTRQGAVAADEARQQYANMNAGIANQAGYYNVGARDKTMLAKLQNDAAERNIRRKAIGNIGENYGQASLAKKSTNQDMATAGMYKNIFNNPEFLKAFEQFMATKK